MAAIGNSLVDFSVYQDHIVNYGNKNIVVNPYGKYEKGTDVNAYVESLIKEFSGPNRNQEALDHARKVIKVPVNVDQMLAVHNAAGKALASFVADIAKTVGTKVGYEIPYSSRLKVKKNLIEKFIFRLQNYAKDIAKENVKHSAAQQENKESPVVASEIKPFAPHYNFNDLFGYRFIVKNEADKDVLVKIVKELFEKTYPKGSGYDIAGPRGFDVSVAFFTVTLPKHEYVPGPVMVELQTWSKTGNDALSYYHSHVYTPQKSGQIEAGSPEAQYFTDVLEPYGKAMKDVGTIISGTNFSENQKLIEQLSLSIYGGTKKEADGSIKNKIGYFEVVDRVRPKDRFPEGDAWIKELVAKGKIVNFRLPKPQSLIAQPISIS